MKQMKSSDFETVADILKTLDLKYNADYETKVQEFFSYWKEAVGEKLAEYSRPKELTSDGVLIIGCRNSVAANELFNSRIKLNEKLKKKAKNLELGFFKYIKITYN